MSSVIPVANSAAFAVSAFSAFKQLEQIVLPGFLQQGGHYQFLTNIALSISFFYAIVNILYYFTGLSVLETSKRYISAVCFSLNSVVSLVYWGLKLTLTHLILASKEERIAFSLDVQIHILPLLFVCVDYFCFMPDGWMVSYMEAYSIIACCAAMYWFWLEYLLDGAQSYPYPFLNVETPQRVVIFFIISIVAFVAFCTGKYLHRGGKTSKMEAGRKSV